MYCPALSHADEDKHEERKKFKLKFNKLLELRSNALLDAGFHVIILGDINISHKRIDHCNPSEVSFENLNAILNISIIIKMFKKHW